MKLNAFTTGTATDLPPVLLAHGLFGSGRNLNGLARRLATDRLVVSVDMRNHGDSPHDPDHSYSAMAADLAQVIEAYGGLADVAGHSMGGKAAMTLALTRPELVRRLAVLDIAPFGYDHSQMFYIDAMQAVDLAGLTLRSEADRRLAEHMGEPGVRAFLLQSLDLKSDPPRWKFNLPVLRAQMDNIVGWPEGLPVAAFTGPALFLAGVTSDYCAGAGIEAIRRWFPQAEIRWIDGAGHWLHADQPEQVADQLAGFFA
ncbi:alpha/beta fold hydrolase [Paracoccus pacificus]|uniref:Alpha/beta fold hydrolase n=1 Tax=Paracoccus pacificus TaxID=1463598 RepID=A0ABW4RC32_9RHOB